MVLRITGERAPVPPPPHVRVDPGPGLFQADSLLGFRLREGRRQVTIDSQLVFTQTVGPAGRLTRPEDEIFSDPTHEIWVLGCSYTFGWSVNDEESWPWRVQQRMPETRILNLAQPGYGEVQMLLLLEEMLQTTAAPGPRPAPLRLLPRRPEYHG